MFFVTCRSTSPGERTRSGAFSEGGATKETVGTAGSREGTAVGAWIFCAGTDRAGAGETFGADVAETAGGPPDGTAAGGGMAVVTGTGAGDFPSFVPSGLTAAPPSAAGECMPAASPRDGIDANSRRNPAAARAFLTTYPSKIPPVK
jgi:hypothetical protein